MNWNHFHSQTQTLIYVVRQHMDLRNKLQHAGKKGTWVLQAYGTFRVNILKKGSQTPLKSHKIVVGKIILWLKQCGSIQRRGIFFGLLFTGTTNTSLLNSVANKWQVNVFKVNRKETRLIRWIFSRQSSSHPVWNCFSTVVEQTDTLWPGLSAPAANKQKNY